MPRPYVEIHRTDAARLEIGLGDLVEITIPFQRSGRVPDEDYSRSPRTGARWGRVLGGDILRRLRIADYRAVQRNQCLVAAFGKTLRQPIRGREVTVVSRDQLTRDMQPLTRQLVDEIGIMPFEAEQPIDADDLFNYLSDASIPMVAFMQAHGLFIDTDGLHFDLAQFGAIKDLAEKVIAAHDASDFGGVWRELDLSGDEDVDYNGGYILTALAALELVYAPPK